MLHNMAKVMKGPLPPPIPEQLVCHQPAEVGEEPGSESDTEDEEEGDNAAATRARGLVKRDNIFVKFLQAGVTNPNTYP